MRAPRKTSCLCTDQTTIQHKKKGVGGSRQKYRVKTHWFARVLPREETTIEVCLSRGLARAHSYAIDIDHVVLLLTKVEVTPLDYQKLLRVKNKLLKTIYSEEELHRTHEKDSDLG